MRPVRAENDDVFANRTAEGRAFSAGSELQPCAEKRPARRIELQTVAETDVPLAGDEVLRTDGGLAVGHIEQVDEQLRRHRSHAEHVLRAQIDLAPRRVGDGAYRIRRQPFWL